LALPSLWDKSRDKNNEKKQGFSPVILTIGFSRNIILHNPRAKAHGKSSNHQQGGHEPFRDQTLIILSCQEMVPDSPVSLMHRETRRKFNDLSCATDSKARGKSISLYAFINFMLLTLPQRSAS
jgi:hypothetical protein